jgi:hypothetical protein
MRHCLSFPQANRRAKGTREEEAENSAPGMQYNSPPSWSLEPGGSQHSARVVQRHAQMAMTDRITDLPFVI